VWVSILAGGWGKRLGPLTRHKPKPLLRIAGKRVIDYTIEQVAKIKPDKGSIIAHPEMIPLHDIPTTFEVVEQKDPGMRNALKTALEGVDDKEIILSFTGYLTRPNDIVVKLLDYYTSSQYPVILAIAPVSSGLETFGFVRLDIGGRVEKLTETLEPWRAGRGYVFAGVLIGKSEVLKSVVGSSFIEGMNKLAQKNLVGAYIWEGDWLELAYPWDVLQAYRLILDPDSSTITGKAYVSPSASIGRGVIIERDAHIDENVVITGPAYIGRKVRIGANSIIGPGTIIEKSSIVEPMSVLKNTVVMENATIEAGSILESTIVGEGAVVPSHTVARAGPITKIPEWMEGLAEGIPPKLVMGAVFAPGARSLSTCTRLPPGSLVDHS